MKLNKIKQFYVVMFATWLKFSNGRLIENKINQLKSDWYYLFVTTLDFGIFLELMNRLFIHYNKILYNSKPSGCCTARWTRI